MVAIITTGEVGPEESTDWAPAEPKPGDSRPPQAVSSQLLRLLVGMLARSPSRAEAMLCQIGWCAVLRRMAEAGARGLVTEVEGAPLEDHVEAVGEISADAGCRSPSFRLET